MKRTRDASTPLILWICAAICVHFIFGGGANEVAVVHEDHQYLHSMATQVRDRVRMEEQTFDVALLASSKKIEADPTPPPPPPPPKPKPPEKEKKQAKPPELAKKDEKKTPEEKKKDEKKTLVVAEEKAKPLPPPPPQADHRIAVKQHADPNQKDNPNAHFIADNANTVKEETAAQLTSHDRDDPDPTPGGNHAGPKEHTGDSERTRIGESEDHAGDKNRAPGEKGTEFEVQKEPMPRNPAPVAVNGPKAQAIPAVGGDGRQAMNAPPTNAPPLAPGAAGETSPEVTSAAEGNWTFNPIRPNPGPGAAQDQGPGSESTRPQAPPTSVSWLGLGGRPGPGQVNLNLSQQGVVAVVGSDELRKEREADGERRRSEHRGSWIASNFERWRSAIENYVSSVKPGNQTALNTAQVPFASYLNAMHNRIHPIFADSFLGSLDSLPSTHPMNDQHIFTSLEIVLTKEGHVRKMGVVHTSGITAFDIAALDSVQRASPFGPAPSAILSPDGNVYLHWEFHRDEIYACSTMNARPFILNAAPKGTDPEPPAPGTPPAPTQEHGVPGNTTESREGLLMLTPKRDFVAAL